MTKSSLKIEILLTEKPPPIKFVSVIGRKPMISESSPVRLSSEEKWHGRKHVVCGWPQVVVDWWGRHAPVSTKFLHANFPCRSACPVGTNAGGYVALIAKGRYREAYALARAPNPFASVCGRVCAHPCEAACRRGSVDAPLHIRALKRVVCEKFGVESSPPFEEIRRIVEVPRPPAPNPGRVAIVGAGPAGLSCAHDLALMGHRVTIFEATEVSGGMMRLGVPEYRLPREIIKREIDFILWLGVELHLGVEVGRDISFGEVCRDFDAVFLACGCRRGRSLKIQGMDAEGVFTALDFLRAVNLGKSLNIGNRVVVVGGGNVAFDVARTARRYGGTSVEDEEHHRLLIDAAVAASRLLHRQVTVVALEAQEEMPADPVEIEEGSEEGIHLLNRRGPKAILVDGGKVVGLETLRVARVFDEHGRFDPILEPGTEEVLECDTVILAVGQEADLSFLGDDHGLEISPRKTIVVDRKTLRTSRKGVFAGGDIAFGPRIIIDAVGDGRRAARSIDTYLTGREDPPRRIRIRVFDTFGYDHPFARGDYEKVPRGRLPVLPVEQRLPAYEVEKVMSDKEAMLEGKRCLHCWVNTIFDSSRMDGSECIQCGGCVDVCPEECIDLVALRRIADGGGGQRLPDGAAIMWLETQVGAALIKDETACIRCGLCARRCPTGVITMQAFYLDEEAELVSPADEVM